VLIRSARTEEDVLRYADLVEAAFGPRDVAGWWREGFRGLAGHFGRESFLLGESDGALVSGLAALPTEVWLGNRATTLGAVGAVATAPDHRRRGHAGELMRAAIRRMRAEGIALSALKPFSADYYRRFGYEYLTHHEVHRFAPSAVEPVGGEVITAPAREEDLAAICVLADQFGREHAFGGRWSPSMLAVLGAFANMAPFVPEDEATADLLVCVEEGVVAGFSVATRPDRREGLSKVPWLVSRAVDGRRSLLAALGERGARVLEVHVPAGDSLPEDLPASARVRPVRDYCQQIRVIDPVGVLELLSPDAEARGVVSFDIADPVFPDEATLVTAEFADGELHAHAGGALGIVPLQLGIGTFSQLVANAIGPVYAAEHGLLRGEPRAVALAGRVFPDWVSFRGHAEP
jgi:predicted N-acetyltransferase YhbS